MTKFYNVKVFSMNGTIVYEKVVRADEVYHSGDIL